MLLVSAFPWCLFFFWSMEQIFAKLIPLHTIQNHSIHCQEIHTASLILAWYNKTIHACSEQWMIPIMYPILSAHARNLPRKKDSKADPYESSLQSFRSKTTAWFNLLLTLTHLTVGYMTSWYTTSALMVTNVSPLISLPNKQDIRWLALQICNNILSSS